MSSVLAREVDLFLCVVWEAAKSDNLYTVDAIMDQRGFFIY